MHLLVYIYYRFSESNLYREREVDSQPDRQKQRDVCETGSELQYVNYASTTYPDADYCQRKAAWHTFIIQLLAIIVLLPSEELQPSQAMP